MQAGATMGVAVKSAWPPLQIVLRGVAIVTTGQGWQYLNAGNRGSRRWRWNTGIVGSYGAFNLVTIFKAYSAESIIAGIHQCSIYSHW